MQRRIGVIVAIGTAILVFGGLISGAVFRQDKPIRVVTGRTAQTLCADAFISGIDPHAAYERAVAARRGIDRLA